jgi:hypothetical protein
MAIAYVDLSNNAHFIHFRFGFGPEGQLFKSASQDLRLVWYLASILRESVVSCLALQRFRAAMSFSCYAFR